MTLFSEKLFLYQVVIILRSITNLYKTIPLNNHQFSADLFIRSISFIYHLFMCTYSIFYLHFLFLFIIALYLYLLCYPNKLKISCRSTQWSLWCPFPFFGTAPVQRRVLGHHLQVVTHHSQLFIFTLWHMSLGKYIHYSKISQIFHFRPKPLLQFHKLNAPPSLFSFSMSNSFQLYFPFSQRCLFFDMKFPSDTFFPA